jgi:hypothetical protein
VAITYHACTNKTQFFFWAAQDVSSHHWTHLGWATGQPGKKKTDTTFVLSAIRTHCWFSPPPWKATEMEPPFLDKHFPVESCNWFEKSVCNIVRTLGTLHVCTGTYDPQKRMKSINMWWWFIGGLTTHTTLYLVHAWAIEMWGDCEHN